MKVFFDKEEHFVMKMVVFSECYADNWVLHSHTITCKGNCCKWLLCSSTDNSSGYGPTSTREHSCNVIEAVETAISFCFRWLSHVCCVLLHIS